MKEKPYVIIPFSSKKSYISRRYSPTFYSTLTSSNSSTGNTDELLPIQKSKSPFHFYYTEVELKQICVIGTAS